MCYRNAPDNVLPKPAYAPENSNAQITDASIIDRTDVNYIQLQTQAELTPMKPIASQTAPMEPIASQTARENSNAQIIDASIIDRTDRNPPEITPSKRFIRLKNQAELTPMKPIASQTEPGVIVDLITPDKPANRIPITSMTPSKELGTLMNRTLSFESGNYF